MQIKNSDHRIEVAFDIAPISKRWKTKNHQNQNYGNQCLRAKFRNCPNRLRRELLSALEKNESLISSISISNANNFSKNSQIQIRLNVRAEINTHPKCIHMKTILNEKHVFRLTLENDIVATFYSFILIDTKINKVFLFIPFPIKKT